MLTPRQVLALQTKIKKIKAALAADKKRWGGYYDDSRGLRYIPPQYYLKLQDYAGAMRSQLVRRMFSMLDDYD